MAQTKEGAIKIAASTCGMTAEQYMSMIDHGHKWCSGCRAWHIRALFGSDASRRDGLSAHCYKSRKERFYRYEPVPPALLGPKGPPRYEARDGDKSQARKHIQLSFRSGKIPHPDSLPCFDCGHVVPDGATSRKDKHEYDHFLGYSVDNHMNVQAVCVPCHHAREHARGNSPGRNIPPQLGETNGMAKLTAAQAAEIYAIAGTAASDVARRYKISAATVRLIQQGKRWSWLNLAEQDGIRGN